MSLLAAFGLPPRSHEDDPFRATQAAREVQSELLRKGFKGRPRALFITAREAELCQNFRQAVRLARESLAAAVRLEMPYEEASGHRQLARLMQENDGLRADEVDKALNLLSRLAAKYDLNQTAALMPGAVL